MYCGDYRVIPPNSLDDFNLNFGIILEVLPPMERVTELYIEEYNSLPSGTVLMPDFPKCRALHPEVSEEEA